MDGTPTARSGMPRDLPPAGPDRPETNGRPGRIQPVDPALLGEAVGRMADDLGITRTELVDALTLWISEQRMVRIAAGMPSPCIPSAAAVGVVAYIIGYLGYLSGPSPAGGPTPLSSAEFSAALEDLAAGHGVDQADLVRFVREAAERRIADTITILRLMDAIEDSGSGR
jgi:hypothetical protein